MSDEYVPHLCTRCGVEVFTNDSGRTWWDGSSGLTACADGVHGVETR